jgi:hypothetical protein
LQTQLAKRLGQLAWKSVNAIITFTEQVHIKTDTEYADAVTHLHTRKCTLSDVDLFNSRLIKSAICENGIDMSTNDYFNATAIVPTNLLRQTMNIHRAETNCLCNNINLINCAAIDTCSSTTLTKQHRTQLLHLDMSSSKLKNALPGFISLHIGMPVILKRNNISM